jgi:hypothetical protein
MCCSAVQGAGKRPALPVDCGAGKAVVWIAGSRAPCTAHTLVHCALHCTVNCTVHCAHLFTAHTLLCTVATALLRPECVSEVHLSSVKCSNGRVHNRLCGRDDEAALVPFRWNRGSIDPEWSSWLEAHHLARRLNARTASRVRRTLVQGGCADTRWIISDYFYRYRASSLVTHPGS